MILWDSKKNIIIGGRVTGLQEAVWDAAKSICDSCGLTGANIGCVKRGCKAVTHYPCALTKGWHLDTNQYIPKCNLHRITWNFGEFAYIDYYEIIFSILQYMALI